MNDIASDREAAQSAPLVPMLALVFVVFVEPVVLVVFVVPPSVVLELPELVEPETSLEELETTAEAEADETPEETTAAEAAAEVAILDESAEAAEEAEESGSDAGRELCERRCQCVYEYVACLRSGEERRCRGPWSGFAGRQVGWESAVSGELGG
jgi:hypothetical protein